MSELLDNLRVKKETLKRLILELHGGRAAQTVHEEVRRLLGEVPYGMVVEVEQELISGGLPASEVQKLCDVHSQALRGLIEEVPRDVPRGHPVDTFHRENRFLEVECRATRAVLAGLGKVAPGADASYPAGELLKRLEGLRDVDKHYRRKENLVFPFLEKYGIFGPSKVMWGKDDEVRALLKAALAALRGASGLDAAGLKALAGPLVEPALAAVEEMVFKEEKILLPMCLEKFTPEEWGEVERQSYEIGFCLHTPETRWQPEAPAASPAAAGEEGRIPVGAGSLSPAELTGLLNALPFDVTFVDKDDRVRFFTQGAERIFDRNEAILGRKVQNCHPPASMHIVQKIVDDFRSGRQSRAPFWIKFKGRFVHIEYHAVRGKGGDYLGTLEVTQDLTPLRALEGEQRLLSYQGAPSPPPADGRPAWFDPARVAGVFDARPVLAAGGHPVAEVMGRLGALEAGKIFALITPFLPEPLIERAAAKGFACWTQTESPELFKTYFTRA